MSSLGSLRHRFHGVGQSGWPSSGASFQLFRRTLVTGDAGRKIVLGCDNGRFPTTKAVFAGLTAHRDQLEIYWLPPYCPSLYLD